MTSVRTLTAALLLLALFSIPAARAEGDAPSVPVLSGGCGEGEPGAVLWDGVGDPPLYRALLSGRGGTFACIELIHDQYRQTGKEEAIEGVPSWLSAAGPLHLINTWSTSYLPFQVVFLPQDDDSGAKVIRTLQDPIAAEAKNLDKEGEWTAGARVEAGLLDLYRVDPIYTLLSPPDAEEAVYVWPDPTVDSSDVFIERRLRPLDDYRTALTVTLYNFGEKAVFLQPALEVHAWERPGKGNKGMFSPPPDILQSLCQAGGDLTREDGKDLAEDGGQPENPPGEAEWIGVGGRYFFQAAVNRKMPKARCQLYAASNGVVSARMYRTRTELQGLSTEKGCVPEWYSAPGRVTCTELAEQLGIELAKLNSDSSVEKALKEHPDFPDMERLKKYREKDGRLSYSFELYSGPKDISLLKKADVGLEDSIDFWIVGILAKPMLQVLKWCHSLTASWTLAIILLTVLVKVLLLPLTQKSFGQMQRMSALKPQMDTLREKYGKDKTRLNQEMMNLYKREKVNPLGGCFPMLLQMPIWIALYRTIYSSAELYQAPMGLWIHDLSAPDPFFVMPLLLGGLMFLQQKMTPTATDSQQAKMMLYIMPVMFTVFMLFLPAGLNLYILVNTILSLVQQYYLKRKFAPPATPAAAGGRA